MVTSFLSTFDSKDKEASSVRDAKTICGVKSIFIINSAKRRVQKNTAAILVGFFGLIGSKFIMLF